MAKKVLPRGYGSVQKDGTGYRAYGTESLGDGKKNSVRKRFPTETEALAWLDELNRRNNNLGASDGTVVPETVGDLLKAFLLWKDHARDVTGKPDRQTLDDYKSTCVNYLLPHLGNVSLDAPDIKARLERLQTHLGKLISEKTGKPLSASRKRNIWIVLRSAYRFGASEGYVSLSPFKNLPAFKVEEENLREKVIPAKDVEKFQSFLEERGCKHHGEHICRLRWELALHSGRRQGEILGMKWDDVLLSDHGDSYMRVTRKAKPRPWQHGCGPQKPNAEWPCGKKQGQYCPKRHGGGIQIEAGTKGGKNIRPDIPLDEELVDMFIEHKKHQQAEAEAAFIGRSINLLSEEHRGMVFTQPKTQRPYGARHDVTGFERILVAAGIKEHYHIHQLRHTAATELADATNGNLPVIADILGHKSINTTRGYISPNMDSKANALDAVKARRKAKKAEKAESNMAAN